MDSSVGTVVVGGVRIAYRRAGRGRPVLLSGGSGMPPVVWEASGFEGVLVDAGFEVISYAARGIAPSDAPPAPYRVEDLAADAAGLLDELELADVVAVGFSLGSYTVEAMLTHHSERLRSAVLLAGAGPTTAVLRAAVAMEAELIAATGHVPPAAAAFQALMTGLGPDMFSVDDERVDEWLGMLSLQSQVWTSVEGERGQSAAVAVWSRDDDRPARLRRVQVPVLVAAYEHDPMFPPATSRGAVDHLPAGEFVEIGGAGHAGLMTHSAETAAALLPFLKRV